MEFFAYLLNYLITTITEMLSSNNSQNHFDYFSYSYAIVMQFAIRNNQQKLRKVGLILSKTWGPTNLVYERDICILNFKWKLWWAEGPSVDFYSTLALIFNTFLSEAIGSFFQWTRHGWADWELFQCTVEVKEIILDVFKT